MSKTLAQRIRQWRAQAKLNREEAARALLVSVSTLTKWEQGHRSPEGLNLERVERLIGVER